MTSPDIEPMTGWSRALIRQMAESIKTARGIKPTSWAILPTKSGVQVNVGKRAACAMDRHRLELLVDVPRLPLSVIRRLAQIQTSPRKRHDETLRKELERIGDVAISPPGYNDHVR